MGAVADRVRLSYPVDALVSYHYYRREADMGPLAESGRLRMIGDSGAFSAYTQGAPISLAEYADWGRRWRDRLYWIAALDVIGDQAATFRNWMLLRSRHELDTIPTLHAPAHPRAIDRYAAEGVDFMGLGGLVTGARANFPWMLSVFRYARDRQPQMRFHLWSVTNRDVLAALPAYSGDSSGILGQAFRYGMMRIFDPATGRDIRHKLDGKPHPAALARILRRVYGVDPATVRTSHAGNRYTLIRLLAASTQQYAMWLQRRHRVPAPKYGINPDCWRTGHTPTDDPAAGTRVHVVGSPRQGRATPNQSLDLLCDEPADGTLVHVVGGSHGGPPQLDILTTTGPRVHVVGGGVSSNSNARLDNLWTGDDRGTRYHVADMPKELRQAAGLEGPRVHIAEKSDGLGYVTDLR